MESSQIYIFRMCFAGHILDAKLDKVLTEFVKLPSEAKQLNLSNRTMSSPEEDIIYDRDMHDVSL